MLKHIHSHFTKRLLRDFFTFTRPCFLSSGLLLSVFRTSFSTLSITHKVLIHKDNLFVSITQHPTPQPCQHIERLYFKNNIFVCNKKISTWNSCFQYSGIRRKTPTSHLNGIYILKSTRIKQPRNWVKHNPPLAFRIPLLRNSHIYFPTNLVYFDTVVVLPQFSIRNSQLKVLSLWCYG